MNDSRYLSDVEVLAAQALPDSAPYAIVGVSHGFFSLARHYGGCTLAGFHYTYIPEVDECIRDDVLKMVKKMRRQAANGPKPEQGVLL